MLKSTNRNIVHLLNDGYGPGSPVLSSVLDSAENKSCRQAKPHVGLVIRAVKRLQCVRCV